VGVCACETWGVDEIRCLRLRVGCWLPLWVVEELDRNKSLSEVRSHHISSATGPPYLTNLHATASHSLVRTGVTDSCCDSTHRALSDLLMVVVREVSLEPLSWAGTLYV
jgi:hypothetical protein